MGRLEEDGPLTFTSALLIIFPRPVKRMHDPPSPCLRPLQMVKGLESGSAGFIWTGSLVNVRLASLINLIGILLSWQCKV